MPFLPDPGNSGGTLEIQINVLHVYLFFRVFSDQHALIETNKFIQIQGKYRPMRLLQPTQI